MLSLWVGKSPEVAALSPHCLIQLGTHMGSLAVPSPRVPGHWQALSPGLVLFNPCMPRDLLSGGCCSFPRRKLPKGRRWHSCGTHSGPFLETDKSLAPRVFLQADQSANNPFQPAGSLVLSPVLP